MAGSRTCAWKWNGRDVRAMEDVFDAILLGIRSTTSVVLQSGLAWVFGWAWKTDPLPAWELDGELCPEWWENPSLIPNGTLLVAHLTTTNKKQFCKRLMCCGAIRYGVVVKHAVGPLHDHLNANPGRFILHCRSSSSCGSGGLSDTQLGGALLSTATLGVICDSAMARVSSLSEFCGTAGGEALPRVHYKRCSERSSFGSNAAALFEAGGAHGVYNTYLHNNEHAAAKALTGYRAWFSLYVVLCSPLLRAIVTFGCAAFHEQSQGARSRRYAQECIRANDTPKSLLQPDAAVRVWGNRQRVTGR